MIKVDIMCLKNDMIEKFHETSDISLYTLKFHLLEHFVEELKIFWSLTALDAFPLEQYNIHINRSYIETYKFHSTRMD